MKSGGMAVRVCLAAALAVALAAPAPAGAEVDDIAKKLAKGDADGLTGMEAFCERTPGASNAFLALSDGYLKIKSDAAKAMDAALRGLEQYDEKWKAKVPKASLYTAFLAAAAKSALTAEMLGRSMARIEKLSKRDAKEAQPILVRYDAFRPAKLVPALASQVQQLQGRGQAGQALVLHDLEVELAKLSELEDSLEAVLKPGRELAQKGRAELDEALKLEGDKQIEQLRALATKYSGHTLGKEAAAKIEYLKKPAAEREAVATSFRAKPAKENPNDQIAAAIVVDTLVVTVTSATGTGSAEVSAEKAEWPKAVVLRFNLADLEVIQIDNGRKKIVGSLLRGTVTAGKDRMTIEKKGKQVDVTLPDGFLGAAADVLKFSWIASYK